MKQSKINRDEWENPQNWTAGLKWGGVYFSRKDTRVWVPKRPPWAGWTLNLARPGGVAWLIGIIIGVALLPTLICVIVTSSGAAG